MGQSEIRMTLLYFFFTFLVDTLFTEMLCNPGQHAKPGWCARFWLLRVPVALGAPQADY